jgi:hypothetical protein
MLPQTYRIRLDSARGKKGGICAHHSTHARDHAVQELISSELCERSDKFKLFYTSESMDKARGLLSHFLM